MKQGLSWNSLHKINIHVIMTFTERSLISRCAEKMYLEPLSFTSHMEVTNHILQCGLCQTANFRSIELL